jgi:hypothetical protein
VKIAKNAASYRRRPVSMAEIGPGLRQDDKVIDTPNCAATNFVPIVDYRGFPRQINTEIYDSKH